MNVLVVGAGVFGVTAAYELQTRGHAVTLCDPGPVPHPLAASTDVSKAVRLDYGDDTFYWDLALRALERWRGWNDAFGERLFHEDGLVLMAGGPMAPGGFEYESYVQLRARGLAPRRLDRAGLAAAMPAWRPDDFPDGYLNPVGGWARSGLVMERLLGAAQACGVQLRPDCGIERLLMEDGRVSGARTTQGETLSADVTVVAVGAWTGRIVPELAGALRSVGQPVFLFRVDEPERWQPPHFRPWAADVMRTGYYGFPALPADAGDLAGAVKVAHHGAGVPIDPDAPREVSPEQERACRDFLRGVFPALADAPLAATRLCLYCEAAGGDFLIDRHPDLAGLVVAAGGSGHAFKFAPVLGELVADVVEQGGDVVDRRFRWRRPRAYRRR